MGLGVIVVLDVEDLDLILLNRLWTDPVADGLSLLVASELCEPVGTHRVKASEGVAVGGTRPDGVLDDEQAKISLAHVVAKTGDDHGQLGPFNVVELARVCRLSGLEGLVEVTQRSLAVDLDGPVQVETGQAPGGANLSERLAVVTGEICRDSGRLPDDGHPARVGGGVARVLVGGLRIVVEEALNHDQVPGNVLSVSTPQGAQLGPGAPFKISRLDVVRDLGFGDALTLRRTTATIVSPVARVIPPGAVVETTWPATIAVATPATALTVSTPFVTPVVTVPSIAASRVLPAVRPLGVRPRAGGIVVLSRPITATRATVLPCKTATCPEAVTLIIAATPACLAVVRAVLTVLIRHGPSFTPALPPVALVLSLT